MEEAARQRRERLAALKTSKADKGALSSDKERQQSGAASIASAKRERDQDGEDAATFAPTTVEKEMDVIRGDLRQQVEELQRAEVDLFTLAPKKIDWDLKRDVEKKLQKLERETQLSIVEQIRKRLKGKNDDIAARVHQ